MQARTGALLLGRVRSREGAGNPTDGRHYGLSNEDSDAPWRHCEIADGSDPCRRYCGNARQNRQAPVIEWTPALQACVEKLKAFGPPLRPTLICAARGKPYTVGGF